MTLKIFHEDLFLFQIVTLIIGSFINLCTLKSPLFLLQLLSHCQLLFHRSFTLIQLFAFAILLYFIHPSVIFYYHLLLSYFFLLLFVGFEFFLFHHSFVLVSQGRFEFELNLLRHTLLILEDLIGF